MKTWDERVDAVWADTTLSEDDVIARIDALAGERDPDDPRALFERAGARDSAGQESEAEPLYRRALARGLGEPHRSQAVIQLASTIRNLGQVPESLALLRAELDRQPASPLRTEAAAFYALALITNGQPEAAASIALQALAPLLSSYRRSVRAYAYELADERI